MISSVFCCRVGAGHEKWQNGLKNQVADLTLFQFLKRALCGELSILTSPSKRKCDLFQQVAFSFGFRFCWSLHPSVSRCSGSAKPPARRPVGCFSSKIANDLREFGLLPLATESLGTVRFQGFPFLRPASVFAAGKPLGGTKERHLLLADVSLSWQGVTIQILSGRSNSLAFKFAIFLEKHLTGLLAGSAFAPYKRFTTGKTLAQGEFTSPEHFNH